MPIEGTSVRGSVRSQGRTLANGLKVMPQPRESFDIADEKKFQALRKQLTDEGYTQVLGFESVPLVHRLFDDLSSLRDTHATLAHNLSEKGANETKLQRQIHPIQKELSRMVRENNQLHLELIQRGEELDTHQRQGSLDTKKLQTKIADQAFIITQQSQHIRELETQVDEHRARLQQLLDPNFTYTSGPAGEALPKGQEIMVSACPKPHTTENDENEVAQVVQDLESATAEQIAGLEEDLKESIKAQELSELEVHSLQDIVRNRENEIKRMGKLLVNNVNSDREDLEKINTNNEDSIKRLNGQLDFVSGQLADAERQKVHTQQLADEVERLSSNEAKLKAVLATANAELQDLRSTLTRPKEAVAGPAVVKVGPSVQQLTKLMEQVSTTTMLLNKVQFSTKSQSWNTLFQHFDVDGSGIISKKEWRIVLRNKFDPVSDEDADILFDIFDGDGEAGIDIQEFHVKVGEVRHEPTRRKLVAELVQRAQSPGGEMHADMGYNVSDAGPAQRVREGQKLPGQTNDALHRQQLEVEALKLALQKRDVECGQLQEQVVRGQQKLGESRTECEQVGVELMEMKRLRDNLYAVVWDFENQMAEVQVKIKELVSAREEKSRQCAEAWDKVHLMERQLATFASTRSGGTQQANSAQSRAVSLDSDAQHVATLLDELREYKVRVQELELQVEKADNELAAWAANEGSGVSHIAIQSPAGAASMSEIEALKASLAASQQHIKSVKSQLEAERQESSEQIAPMHAKLEEKERAIEQLQSLMSNMDETRGQVVSQLKVHMESSQQSRQQTGLLENEVKRLLGELRRLEDEVVRSKSAITDIDGERDTMLNQLEERTHMVRTLEGRLGDALKDHDTSLADQASVQQQADMLRQALNEHDARNKALKQQLHNEVQQRNGAEQLCNAKMEEARVLSADLGTMTRENQVVNDELAMVVAQRDALKRDLDEALQRLSVAQQMVQGREKEKQDILMSYRALNEEKQRTDAGTDRVAMELHQVRAQVYAREEELMRARETISSLEQEQQRMAIDLLGLQRHSDLVSEKLLEAQDGAKHEGAERESLKSELTSAKNVSALIEKQKHDAVREGALLRDEIVALRTKISNLTAEKDLVRGQMQTEKSKVRDLEDLLQALRAKEHAAVNAEQAATTDSVGMHQRLQAALSENEKNVQELRLLRSRREELEYELEKHRRLVSHESMDKDSATSELGVLKTNVRELHFVVEQQNSALQAKQEELALQRDRLLKIQSEAEVNERRVRELDTKLRMSEDANKALQVSTRQHNSSLEQHTTEKDELRSALRRTEEQLDKIHSQYKHVKAIEKEYEVRVSGLSAENASLEGQRDRLTADLAQARTQVSSRIREVETVTELLDKMDREYRDLQGKFLQQHTSSAAPHTPAATPATPSQQTPAAQGAHEDGE